MLNGRASARPLLRQSWAQRRHRPPLAESASSTILFAPAGDIEIVTGSGHPPLKGEGRLSGPPPLTVIDHDGPSPPPRGGGGPLSAPRLTTASNPGPTLPRPLRAHCASELNFSSSLARLRLAALEHLQLRRLQNGRLTVAGLVAYQLVEIAHAAEAPPEGFRMRKTRCRFNERSA